MINVTTVAEADPELAHTRSQVLDIIVTDGPVTATELASRLGLTAAGVRRHLAQLADEGQIQQYEVPTQERGRGRPARSYVATPRAHQHLTSECSDMAVEALRYLAETVGAQAVEDFARRRVQAFEQRYATQLAGAGDDLEARAAVLAQALSDEGYAATTRPLPMIGAVQLCQGHCPVGQVATEFPQLCEAEAEAFSRMLGVHVQRLATLAGGEHVCTTNIPVARPRAGVPAGGMPATVLSGGKETV